MVRQRVSKALATAGGDMNRSMEILFDDLIASGAESATR
jgi:hypothetical protein